MQRGPAIAGAWPEHGRQRPAGGSGAGPGGNGTFSGVRVPGQTRAYGVAEMSGAGDAGEPILHVVLVTPEIPPNTGSVARLCVAVGARLHLVGPFGFSLDDKHLKRAGLDYWPYVDLSVYDDWADFCARAASARDRQWFYYSARAEQSYLQARYSPGDWLVFGGESRGLPEAIVGPNRARLFAIPMRGARVRSLNLACAVSIVVYEALRQMGAVT